MPAAVRALRGATTVDADTTDQVNERVQALVTEMLDRNGVAKDDLISIFFTATDDIHCTFPATAARAVGLGDVPLSAVAAESESALAGGGVVTDVGSVKAPIVASLPSPRFVGGHPMAGSEQEGVDGAGPSLFEGSTWVLTPTAATDPAAYTLV